MAVKYLYIYIYAETANKFKFFSIEKTLENISFTFVLLFHLFVLYCTTEEMKDKKGR